MPEIHTMVSSVDSALDRMPEIRGLVEQETYFVIHAPRQTGKTTTVKALVREINAKGDAVALC